jgi:hypothetical protein
MIISTNLDYEIEVEEKYRNIDVYFNQKLYGTLGNCTLKELNHQKLRQWIIDSFKATGDDSFNHENYQPFYILDATEELDLK